mmetsp:Transcript_27400/g.38571  ORF Transcript_27400/g.38571 Transcript_27400/m.38571 type:complete len:237 (-) Transcript_27400:108-818(-)
MSSVREEEILVLYGSQTGNSEQAAQDLCEQLPSKLAPKFEGKINLSARHMQLDDFLEIEYAPWTRLVVIMTSSYGVGQAPLGCYRYREFCDALLENNETKLLTGITYAMLGLGDSKYTTFFQNPTVIDKAMTAAGAKRVGPLGKVDASGTGDDAQLEVIARWIQGIWPVLEKAIQENPTQTERLQEITDGTVKLCSEINPDFSPAKKENKMQSFFLPCLVALLGVAAWYFLSGASQ